MIRPRGYSVSCRRSSRGSRRRSFGYANVMRKVPANVMGTRSELRVNDLSTRSTGDPLPASAAGKTPEASSPSPTATKATLSGVRRARRHHRAGSERGS